MSAVMYYTHTQVSHDICTAELKFGLFILVLGYRKIITDLNKHGNGSACNICVHPSERLIAAVRFVLLIQYRTAHGRQLWRTNLCQKRNESAIYIVHLFALPSHFRYVVKCSAVIRPGPQESFVGENIL